MKVKKKNLFSKTLFSLIGKVAAIYILLAIPLLQLIISQKILSSEQFNKLYSVLSITDLILIVPGILYIYFRWIKQHLDSLKGMFVFFISTFLIIFWATWRTVTPIYGTITSSYGEQIGTINRGEAFIQIIVIAFGLYVIHILYSGYLLLRTKKKYALLNLLKGIAAVVSILVLVPYASFATLLVFKFVVFEKMFVPITYSASYIDQSKKLIISDSIYPILECSLQENNNLIVRVFQIINGNSIAITSTISGIYNGNGCVGILLPADVSISNPTEIKKMAVAAEILLRRTYGDSIVQNTNKAPHQIINLTNNSELSFAQGLYNRDSNSIFITNSVVFLLETIIHEQLHAFSSNFLLPLSYNPRSGLEEAMTQYLTRKAMQEVAVQSTDTVYTDQVAALKQLLRFIDEKTLVDVYFNDQFQDVSEKVDAATYPGAFCSFNYYLDNSVIFLVDTHDFEMAHTYAQNASKVLEDKSLSVSAEWCR